jgi:hypothetical protein
MNRKLNIALAVGIMFVGAALNFLPNTASALVTLFVGGALLVYTLRARKDSEDTWLFQDLENRPLSDGQLPTDPSPIDLLRRFPERGDHDFSTSKDGG